MSESLQSKSCDLQRKGCRTMRRHIKPAPTPNQWGGIPNTQGTTPQPTPNRSPIGSTNSIEHNAQTHRATCGTSPGPRAGHHNGKPGGESTPHRKLTPCTKIHCARNISFYPYEAKLRGPLLSLLF